MRVVRSIEFLDFNLAITGQMEDNAYLNGRSSNARSVDAFKDYPNYNLVYKTPYGVLMNNLVKSKLFSRSTKESITDHDLPDISEKMNLVHLHPLEKLLHDFYAQFDEMSAHTVCSNVFSLPWARHAQFLSNNDRPAYSILHLAQEEVYLIPICLMYFSFIFTYLIL